MEKSNKKKFHAHFERVLRRLKKRYDDDKNYFDGRRSWPITGWIWSESGDSIVIGFGYGEFLIVFQHEKPGSIFKASAQVGIHVPLHRTSYDELVDPSKTVVEFELEITEPTEPRKAPVLRFGQGVKNDRTANPDEMRLFGELVREFIHHESCRELRVNFEVLVEYAVRQAACRKIIEMAGDSLDKQFSEIKIAWPSVGNIDTPIG